VPPKCPPGCDAICGYAVLKNRLEMRRRRRRAAAELQSPDSSPESAGSSRASACAFSVIRFRARSSVLRFCGSRPSKAGLRSRMSSRMESKITWPRGLSWNQHAARRALSDQFRLPGPDGRPPGWCCPLSWPSASTKAFWSMGPFSPRRPTRRHSLLAKAERACRNLRRTGASRVAQLHQTAGHRVQAFLAGGPLRCHRGFALDRSAGIGRRCWRS